MDPNRVQVAPFGPKLCQNDAPDLRIILGALRDYLGDHIAFVFGSFWGRVVIIVGSFLGHVGIIMAPKSLLDMSCLPKHRFSGNTTAANEV